MSEILDQDPDPDPATSTAPSQTATSRLQSDNNPIVSRVALAGQILAYILAFFSIGMILLSSCSVTHKTSSVLTRNVHLELVDWHIVGLWVINCPVCWIRVANYNDVPVKNIRFRYKTFGYDGEQLTDGTYTIEYTVPPGTVKNFTEQYIGLVDLESDMLSLDLESVEAH